MIPTKVKTPRALDSIVRKRKVFFLCLLFFRNPSYFMGDHHMLTSLSHTFINIHERSSFSRSSPVMSLTFISPPNREKRNKRKFSKPNLNSLWLLCQELRQISNKAWSQGNGHYLPPSCYNWQDIIGFGFNYFKCDFLQI